ncbi:hypothetical protein KQI68_07190 [Peptoniphilus sp. MSJ-1]|uniref:Single-stranded DNA-binding protein n=1 Tax=Peptoniphilus ovalis TaxID=2841503 RepID=A0ABS6FHH7_9FIRM|nr:hypothetical protein [Peptoniphilus ovalis]MBU5669623.1 hypothetical protein [Peptoniphilus ovalis]
MYLNQNEKEMVFIKAQYDARFLASGTLEKIERVEYSNGTKELLKITLKAGEDFITYTTFNTKKDPQRIKRMMTELRKGDFLKARGTVSINEYEDKQGNLRENLNYTAFVTEHIEPIDNPKAYITIAGILKKKIDTETERGKEITIEVYDDFRGKSENYKVSLDESMEGYFDDIEMGDNISVTAEYISRSVADVDTSSMKSYGKTIDNVAPAGVNRKYINKINVVQGYILAEESELEDEEDFPFPVDNEDIPF